MKDLKLMLFNRDDEYVGNIEGVVSAKHSRELSGEDYIEYIDIEAMDSRIEKGYRILFQDKRENKIIEFIVVEMEEFKEGKQVFSFIHAENSIIELMGDFIEDKKVRRGLTLEAVEKALEGTRWNIGTIEESDRKSMMFYRTNSMMALHTILKEYEMELETVFLWDKSKRKLERKINVLNQVGTDRGTRISYTRNNPQIKRKTLDNRVITALYGFGMGEEVGDGYTRRITFESINNGKAYVENDSARKIWGRQGDNKEKVHVFDKIEFDGIEDKAELLKMTKAELAKRSKPAVSYEVKMADLYSIAEINSDYFELGDNVFVLDRDFSPFIEYKTRILRIDRDLLNVDNTEVVLGELVRNVSDSISQKPITNIVDKDSTTGEIVRDLESPKDFVEKYPSLKIGLSSWVDANDSKAVMTDGDSNIISVNDTLVGDTVYQKGINGPKLIERDGYKWISFNPTPMVVNRWSGAGQMAVKPEKLMKQYGEYLNYEKNNDEIKAIFVVYYDRTDEPLNGTDLKKPRIEDMYKAGASCPLGHTFSSLPTYDLVPVSPGVRDRTFDGKMDRVREEMLIVKIETGITKSKRIYNLGMNKKEYNDFHALSIGRLTYQELSGFFKGEIAEVILYKRELDRDETAVMVDYLTDKYNGMYELVRL